MNKFIKIIGPKITAIGQKKQFVIQYTNQCKKNIFELIPFMKNENLIASKVYRLVANQHHIENEMKNL